ncbi:MAG: FAD-dependent oxidoreductase [Bacillota bacterium]
MQYQKIRQQTIKLKKQVGLPLVFLIVMFLMMACTPQSQNGVNDPGKNMAEKPAIENPTQKPVEDPKEGEPPVELLPPETENGEAPGSNTENLTEISGQDKPGGDTPKQENIKREPTDNAYDVIVIGSDPEGIAAALSSSRNGNLTLLIDSRKTIGGLFTLGKLNSLDMNFDADRRMVTRGIFGEFQKQMGGYSFDIDLAQKTFDKMVKDEKNLHLKLEENIVEVIKNDNQITGIKTKKGLQENTYSGKIFIDATQDGDIAYQAGVDFTYAQEDFGVPYQGQVVTLVFEVGGANWAAIKSALNDPKLPRSSNGATNDSAWGFFDEMSVYQGIDPQIRTRGLNIGRLKSGNVLINCMHIFGVDGLDLVSKKEGIARGAKEAEHIVEHMKKQIPAFKNAYLVGVADELYIRETRHMEGLYRLSINDVLGHVDFWDKIAIGSYPVDLQPTSMANWGFVVGNPDAYSVPFRSLVPKKIQNLMVVGRAASFDSLAHGSARVVPIGMCTGQAAGAAAKILLDNKLTVQQLADSREQIKNLQDILKKQGAYLPKLNYADKLQNQPAGEAVKFLRKYGLVFGGYDNNYDLNGQMPKGHFLSVVERLHFRLDKRGHEEVNKPEWLDLGPITGAEGIQVLEAFFDKKIEPDQLSFSFNEQDILTKGQAYMLIVDAIE